MGTDIFRIKNAMKSAKLPEPIFEFDGFFTIYLKRNNKNNDNGGLNGGLNSGLNENLMKILDLIVNNPGIKLSIKRPDRFC